MTYLGRTSCTLFLLNQLGEEITPLENYIDFQWARAEKQVGSSVFTFPTKTIDTKFLLPEYKIEIYRGFGDSKQSLDGNTQWIIRGITLSSSEDGEELVSIHCEDLISLLNRREIAYNSDNSYTSKLDEADDMIKAIVRENMSSLATDANRQISSNYFTVQANKSLAPIVRKDGMSRRRVLDVIQELCEYSFQLGTYLSFDIVPVTRTQLEFRVFTGQLGADKSDIYISRNNENLGGSSLKIDYLDERNFIYALGEGVANIRAVATAQDNARINKSPFARTELSVDARVSGGDANYLSGEAQYQLSKNRPKITYEAALVETQFFRRGHQFNYGDKLSVHDFGQTYICHLDAIQTGINSDGKEESNLRLRSETYLS